MQQLEDLTNCFLQMIVVYFINWSMNTEQSRPAGRCHSEGVKDTHADVILERDVNFFFEYHSGNGSL